MPMSGAELVQSVATGLANGAIYGLVALGFSLVFRLTRVLSFAHGDLVVAATLTGVFVTVGSTPVVQSLSPAASVAFVVVALAGGSRPQSPTRCIWAAGSSTSRAVRPSPCASRGCLSSGSSSECSRSVTSRAADSATRCAQSPTTPRPRR
ncbi:MAG: hypothetical protein LC640_02595 [Frankia sp.]|nr:hypothetical protein [Frankia sp.]